MANRFFVDGLTDNDWSGSDNWSTLSGGSGGASVPGTTDLAILDGNSPSACDIDGNSNCGGIDTSAWTGTIDFPNGAHYLRSYGNVTTSANTTLTQTGGGGYFHFYDDAAGGTIAINSSTSWGCGIRFGNANISPSTTFTFTSSFTTTGDHIYFSDVSHTSYLLTINQTGASVVTWNPSGTGEMYLDSGQFGDVRGNLKWKITGTANVRIFNTSDTYYFGLPLEVATGGAITLFGAGGGAIIRVGADFELQVSGTGTIVGDAVTTPIPYFYQVDDTGVSTGGKVAFNDNFHYRMYWRQSATTQYWYDESTGVTFNDHCQTYVAGGKVYYSNNGKHECTTWTSNSVNETRYMRGDSGIKFGDFTYITGSTSSFNCSVSYNAADADRYEFRDIFKTGNATSSYGAVTFLGEHATLKSRFYIWHNCKQSHENAHFTKIDALSEGQACWSYGDPTLTNTTGVGSDNANLAVWKDDGTTPTLHTYYKNEIYDPVTVSGTVELSATPQANARVHVVTGQTDEDGDEWLMLRHVLVTNGSGQWTCSVPRNATVYVSAHYDSGATKYNSLSKPYISAV